MEIPGRIPISVHPLFWVLSLFIGFIFSQGNLLLTFPWVIVVFVSVLVHEYGHALTALFFGKRPRISLVALGGLTTYDSLALSLKKQFLIILNGPLFGFALALVAFLLLKIPFLKIPALLYFFSSFIWINLFWSAMNLLPVFPLDGAQLLKVILEGLFHAKGVRASFLFSALFSLALSLFCFFLLQGGLFLGLIFFIFAFQSFEVWRRSRLLSDPDQVNSTKEAMMQGERALRENRKDAAIDIFQQVRSRTKEGMLFTAATQYLAALMVEKGEKKQAYELLLSLKELSDEATVLLHDLASELGDFSLVAKLSSDAYQLSPSKKTALQNAKAFAFLKQGKAAGGWLVTASEFGDLDFQKLFEDKAFKEIATNPDFQSSIPKKNK